MDYITLTGYIDSVSFELVFLVGTKANEGRTATVPRSGSTDDFITDLKILCDENGDCYVATYNKKYDSYDGDYMKDYFPFSAKYDGEEVDFEKCKKEYSV